MSVLNQSRYMPAEWATQQALILTWPHEGTDWCDRLTDVEPVFFHIARTTLAYQDLFISCENVFRAEALERELNQWALDHGLPGRVQGLMAPSNDTWARDHGPLCVYEDGDRKIIDFHFNGWGRKYDWEKDNAITTHLWRQGVFGQDRVEPVDFVLEGGAVESDGCGSILTTSQCLLASNRNPGMTRPEIEQKLSETLGARRVLWLNHGYLAGDDTDGHIDTLARFCDEQTIAYVRCDAADDEHHDAFAAMESELRRLTQSNGEPYRLVPLPWPAPIHDEDGARLPATYANFLIINGAVLLPVYDVPQDTLAESTLSELFPDRQVIPIPCREIIKQHGSLHCLTMQLPAERPL